MATAADGASKVTIEEEAPRIRQIEGVPTGDTGMVAVTQRGPVGLRVLSTSFEEWRRTFGEDIADGDGASGARGFFAEGGQHLYTVRTVHYTDIDDASSKTSDAATIDIETGATSPTAGMRGTEGGHGIVWGSGVGRTRSGEGTRIGPGDA